MSYSEEVKDKSEWNTYKLDDVYDFSSGLSKSSKEFGFGYPFVTFKDVFYNYFIPQELTELANTTEKERVTCSVMRGDVFLTRTSETMDELGKSSVAIKDYPEATFNGFTKRLRPNGKIEVYPEYAGYYFRSPKFRAEINSMATMTTRASLNNDMMARLKIVLPKIETQKSIASILSSLDSKIELNNEINKTLEEMAQALFKRWFIDFEFPNEDGEPYKTSGGEMVESELGMIPKGWKSGVLGELIKVQNGYAFKSKDLNDEGNIRVIKIKNISNNSVNVNTSQFITNEIYRNIDEKFKIYSGDLLIAMTGAEVGKIGIVPKLDEILMLNQRVGKIQEVKKGGKAYAFNMMIENTFKEKVLSIASGSAQPNISASGIENIKLVIADDIVMLKFSGLVDNFIKRKCENDYETNMLSNLRDLLLPKLMSGEIKVEDIEASL